MKLLSRSAFYHRQNHDGTWDAICMKCFLTVTTAPKEEDLEASEECHDCAELMKAEKSVFWGIDDGLR